MVLQTFKSLPLTIKPSSRLDVLTYFRISATVACPTQRGTLHGAVSWGGLGLHSSDVM